jgi:2-hydroxy-6-oxonona-2,4-dienedioate hydrolase
MEMAGPRTSLKGGAMTGGEQMGLDDNMPRSARATVRGIQMYYRFSATASESVPAYPIVLVHGLGVSSGYMVPTMRALPSRARVYAPDLPGFGKSEKLRRSLDIPELAQYVHEWMQEIGVQRAHVLGHSLGAQVVVDLASRWPSRIASLILAGPTTDHRAPTVPRQGLRLLRDMLREPLALWLFGAMEFMEAGPRRTIRTMQAAIRDPFLRKVQHLRAPLLIVRGECDPISPREWTQEVASLVPGARLATILGGPHAINFNNPRELAALILDFTRAIAEEDARSANIAVDCDSGDERELPAGDTGGRLHAERRTFARTHSSRRGEVGPLLGGRGG